MKRPSHFVFVYGSLLVGLIACKSHSNQATPPTPVVPDSTASSSLDSAGSSGSASTPPAHPWVAPAERARAHLQRQIDASLGHDDTALKSTFASDAILFVSTGAQPATDVSDLQIGGGGPDGESTTKATIVRLVADGTADAVWFYADVATEHEAPNNGKIIKYGGTTRVAELIVASESWQAVTASFSKSLELRYRGYNEEVLNATGANGPLATLVTSPSALGAKLTPTAIVVGPTSHQFATGDAARTALAGWKLEPLTLYKRAREVSTSTYGFVQASLDHPEAKGGFIDRLSVQMFAVPKADKSWSVVFVQYIAQ